VKEGDGFVGSFLGGVMQRRELVLSAEKLERPKGGMVKD
jgi:hypothetical protein